MSAETKDPGNITIETRHTVLTTLDTTHYSIRRFDWNRVTRGLDNCDVSSGNVYANAGWAFLGIAASAGLTLLTLSTVPAASRPAWLYPTFIVVAIAAIVVATVCLLTARDKNKANVRAVASVRQDMKEIEDSFKSGGAST